MACNADQEINPKTGRCIKKCSPGTKRNPATGRCVKDAPAPIPYMQRPCPEGQERVISGNCVKKCDPGKIRNPDTGRCVKDAAAPAAAAQQQQPAEPEVQAKLQAPEAHQHPKCAENQELNPKTGRCIKKCAAGTKRNPKTGRCVKHVSVLLAAAAAAAPPVRAKTPSPAAAAPSGPACPEGKELNPKTKKCIKKCGAGTRRNPATGRCIKGAPTPSLSSLYTHTNSLITTAHVKQRALFLNTICSDSGVCLAFGKEDDKIKRFFDKFYTFTYTNPSIPRVGAVSSNGFVNMLEYDREQYRSYAILKSSAKSSGDNLYYEYLIGRFFINRQKRRFPCFVETYGIFKYINNDRWKAMQVQKKSITNLNDYMMRLSEKDPTNLATSCKSSKYLAILIENIKGAETLSNMSQNKDFVENDLVSSLFQVYSVLSHLAKEFTHYDLHASNVLVYSPFDTNKYIEFHYHLKNGKTVTFKSKYITKIIDYGRSFYTNGKHTTEAVGAADFRHNSNNVLNTLCSTESCNNDTQKCGNKVGYNYLNYGSKKENYYISAKTNNISHDLRLLHIMWKYIKKIIADNRKNIKIPEPFLLGYFDHIRYDETYGTPEVLQNGYMTSQKINNVYDGFAAINKAMANTTVNNMMNNYYSKYTKAGDLHVYFDGRDMKFESAV